MHLQILNSIVTALVATFLISAPATAQSQEEELLSQLRDAPETEAKRLERELELIWSASGSPAMDLLLKRGRDALEEEDTSRAIEHLSALTDHAPEFAEGWHLRATAFYRAGLFGPAFDDLERALSLNPNNFNAIFGLAVMLQEFGNLQRASEAYDRVLALHPHHEQAREAKERLAGQGIDQTL